MSGRLLLLHLSDIHVKDDRHPALAKFAKIRERIREYLRGCDRLIILISGDLAYSGKAEEYALLEKGLLSLTSDLDLPLTWVLVPGNHDGTFKDAPKSRKHAIQGVLSEGEAGIDDSVIEACVAPQSEYFAFEDRMVRSDEFAFRDRLLSVQEIEVSGKSVALWGLNVSWMSQVPEQQGKLVFPVARYEHLLRRHADLRLAVLHHPLNWYAQGSFHPLREFLYRNFCAVLSGHEHVANGHMIQSIVGSGRVIALEAGALAPHELPSHSEFSLLELDVLTNKGLQRQFSWSREQDSYILRDERTRSIALELSPQRTFEPTDATRDKLEELGAPFANSVKALKLSDVYIEPRFREFDLEDQGTTGAKFSELVDDIASIGRVLLRGDDHYGKTSFLYRTFLKLLDADQVPVLMIAKDLATGTDDQRQRRIEDAVEAQFGPGALNAFRALPTERKVLLVDDLDSLGAREDSYLRLLTFASEKFQNVLLTVSERFDASVIGSSKVAALLGEYTELRMLGFSYAMRTELITRWYSLDGSLSRGALDEKVHTAQDQIDAAVGKAVVPSTAFNTLMILQALEATQKSQVVDAGIAQHYDLLMRRRLLDSGAAAKRVEGIYTYLAHLAWWMKKRDTSILDRTELDAFNTHYSASVHPTELSKRLELLVNARILQVSDGAYRFRYPASKYFFLSHYISENIDEDASLRKMVEDACRHLYLKENANLIVFLTSKTASKWILREVADVLSSLLKDVSIFNVLSDARILNSWVSKTARLAIADTPDKSRNREEQRHREEEAQRSEDSRGETEKVGSVSELDPFSQINLVFKTSEILGLILKTRIEGLSTDLKDELLEELFQGPLRAISFFLSSVNSQPDALVELLSKTWEKKLPSLTEEQRQKLAQRLIYYSLGAYSQALLLRQGEIVGSPDLTHYVQRLVEKRRSEEKEGSANAGVALTSRLVAVATRLSYPGDIPHTEIERLAKDLKENPFGYSLLQGVVANHLYMFSVQYDTRHRLAAAVNIDLKRQLARDMSQQDKKVVEQRAFQRRNPRGLIQRLMDTYLARNKAVADLLDKDQKRNA